jgi:hypothetical protein
MGGGNNEYVLLTCGRDPSRAQPCTMTPAALDRLANRVAPVPPCPVCRGRCTSTIQLITVTGDGNVLVHNDDQSGGSWSFGFTYSVRL